LSFVDVQPEVHAAPRPAGRIGLGLAAIDRD
jgi:hypothetical protein